MNLTDITLAIAESNPDAKQFKFTTCTYPKLNKKNRTTKEPTTFTVEKRSEFIASVGVNYEKEINDLLESQGKPRDFNAQKAAGKHYINGTNWLMESDNKPGVFYIALSRFTNRSSKYYINGVEATPEQVTNLKENYLPKSKESTSDKPAIEWLTYLIDNIISVEAV
jgi:hypothetical protein